MYLSLVGFRLSLYRFPSVRFSRMARLPTFGTSLELCRMAGATCLPGDPRRNHAAAYGQNQAAHKLSDSYINASTL